MKIYQLHEHSGCYEDYRDIIIGSYLKKKRAQEEKAKAEAREKELREHSDKCRDCPFIWDMDSLDNLNNFLSMYPNYCSEMALEESYDCINCTSFYSKWDDCTYKIVEVEVEE